jgi:hypothetical protein
MIRRHRIVAALTLLAACGGIAVIDADTGSGGSSSTQSNNSSSDGSGGTLVGPDVCKLCNENPVDAGTLANPAITEASGIAASRTHAGILYLHNDSGDVARFFASDLQGADRGSYTFPATARDIEDMAVADCPDATGSCIYLADIGDNDEKYGSYTIHRIAEPATISPGDHMVSIAESITFSYPDGSHNAETLLAAADGLYVVTKVASGPAGIYRLPLSGAAPTVAQKVGELDVPGTIPFITAGDASADGILIRTYSSLFLFPAKGDVPTTLAGDLCTVSVAIEMQGEAAAWLADGIGYVTVSEGAASALHTTTCR